jgi:riboflavin kinase/FMN adenylyltransferase
VDTTLVRSLEDLAPAASAVTVGSFDGMHAGHQAVIERVRERARQDRLRSVVVIPDAGGSPGTASPSEARVLMTSARRLRTLLVEACVDVVVLMPCPVDRAMLERLDARVVLVDPDSVDSSDAFVSRLVAGDRIGSQCTVEVVEPPVIGGVPVRSPEIIRRLREGDIEWVTMALGRPYVFEGTVVEGDRRGRHIGFPTLNVSCSEPLSLPGNGVYAGHVEIPTEAGRDAVLWPAVTNVGMRPTFDKRALSVEAHLLDFEGDLYGADVAVSFEHRLRAERRFAGVDELVAQIDADVRRARDLLDVPTSAQPQR